MSFHAKCTPRLGTFSLREVYNNNKTKSENTMISHVQWIAHVNYLRVCLSVHAWSHVFQRTVWGTLPKVSF